MDKVIERNLIGNSIVEGQHESIEQRDCCALLTIIVSIIRMYIYFGLSLAFVIRLYTIYISGYFSSLLRIKLIIMDRVR